MAVVTQTWSDADEKSRIMILHSSAFPQNPQIIRTLTFLYLQLYER